MGNTLFRSVGEDVGGGGGGGGGDNSREVVKERLKKKLVEKENLMRCISSSSSGSEITVMTRKGGMIDQSTVKTVDCCLSPDSIERDGGGGGGGGDSDMEMAPVFKMTKSNEEIDVMRGVTPENYPTLLEMILGINLLRWRYKVQQQW